MGDCAAAEGCVKGESVSWLLSFDLTACPTQVFKDVPLFFL
jgi:hypothetical protein